MYLVSFLFRQKLSNSGGEFESKPMYWSSIKWATFIIFWIFYLFILLIVFYLFPLAYMKNSNYLKVLGGLCLFKGLHLLFLPNVPGAMFIQGAAPIPNSRVWFEHPPWNWNLKWILNFTHILSLNLNLNSFCKCIYVSKHEHYKNKFYWHYLFFYECIEFWVNLFCGDCRK